MVIVTRSLTGICVMLSFLMLPVTHGTTECPRERFGESCQYICHCEGGRCNKLGQCLHGSRCQHGFSGSTCQNVLAKCDPGWFGVNCQYKCLCTKYRCDYQGQCIEGSKCKPGYFGPACQYGDILQLTSLISDVPLWLRDGDDSTCNSDPGQNSVAIRFRYGISFTWFRLIVKNSGALHGFDVKLNDNMSCFNMRNATFNDKTVDVYCDVDVAVHSLIIVGDGVSYLCSVYISLGRNVASREPPSMSPIRLHGELKTSPFSDDMNEESTVYRKANNSLCLKSELQEIIPSWIYRFNNPQIVTAFLLTKRLPERLTAICLKTYNINGQLINSFEADKYHTEVYIVRPEPISLVAINAMPSDSLISCDIFMFGETLCPEGRYGLDCTSRCNCSDNRYMCFTSTGRCAEACSAGFYGFNCSVPCPSSCKYGVCASRYGDCDISPENSQHVLKLRSVMDVQKHTKDNFTFMCPHGYFGKDCITECPSICNKKCDPISGACLICDMGHYGPNCSNVCDEHCLNQDCEADTGLCKECDAISYGEMCQFKCGKNCYLYECNATTGKCFSCAPGYKGEGCLLVPWNVTLFIVLLFLIPSVIACFFCCEVFSEEEAEDNGGSLSTLSLPRSTVI